MPSFETLTYAVDDRVAVVTLNRPEKLNAFNTAMMLDLISAFDEADGDDGVRAVVVTGAGRAFCAGADLSAAGGSTFDYATRGDPVREATKVGDLYRDGGGRVALRIYESDKPVISAVNGAAVGVGATMQLPMDVRLASTTARFGFVFVRRGITPEACSSWFLPRLVGPQTALEWCLTGRLFGAEEALRRGLVHALHAPEDLMAEALKLAREIADNAAPVSAAITRRLIWTLLGADDPMEAHKADSRSIQSRGRSADAREGVSAFLEKRTPVWPDLVSAGLPDLFPDHPPHPFK